MLFRTVLSNRLCSVLTSLFFLRCRCTASNFTLLDFTCAVRRICESSIYIYIYIYLYRRLGGERAARAPPVTGKSFRFVCACARCPLPSESEPQTSCRPFSLFPFGPGRLSLFPFWGWPFPFALRSKVNPPSPPPNLLSSFSWPYG